MKNHEEKTWLGPSNFIRWQNKLEDAEKEAVLIRDSIAAAAAGNKLYSLDEVVAELDGSIVVIFRSPRSVSMDWFHKLLTPGRLF